MASDRIIQNAYYVSDLDAAIARFHQLWGLGPFFVRRHIALDNVVYRGEPSELDISAAYTQSGDIMIELVTQHNDAHSTFRDRYQPTESGFHHVALAFGDHDQQVKRFNELGYASVTSFKTAEGRGATYLDTVAAISHATEIYIVNDSLRELYASVRHAAETWDARDLVIDL
jgi:hypothetical protein